MRTIAALGITQPKSFITSLRTGVPGIAASIMPKIPPIDVPSQSTVSAWRLAMRVTMSLRYTG
jgi:hypothetical protein